MGRDAVSQPGGVGEVPRGRGPGEGGGGSAHQRGRADHDDHDADPQVDLLVADEPRRDPLVNHVGLLEEQLPARTVVPTMPMISSMTEI